MSGFVIQLTSMMCLLVILTGPVSSALQNGPWKPALPVPQTYPSDPNDPYYQGKLFHVLILAKVSHLIYRSWINLDIGISYV